jgi:hypothetical protein
MTFTVQFIFLILSLLFVNSSFAGLAGLTWHSRANCINNESITWDFTRYRELYTESSHFIEDDGRMIDHHAVEVGWEFTWRSAAVHWGEGRGGWTVGGMQKNHNK